MAGADRDAGHGDAADLGEHGGRVVAAPPARPGDDQDQVGLAGRAPQLRRQGVRVVRHHRADRGHRAELAAAGGEHERVRVDDVAEPGHAPGRPDLVPGRDDRDDGPPGDRHRGVPAGRRGGQVAGPQPPPRGHQDLARRRSPRPPRARSARGSRAAGRRLPALAAAAITTPPSACGSRRSRTTTVSVPAGIGSPVSIHSNDPAASRTVPSPADPAAGAGPPGRPRGPRSRPWPRSRRAATASGP